MLPVKTVLIFGLASLLIAGCGDSKGLFAKQPEPATAMMELRVPPADAPRARPRPDDLGKVARAPTPSAGNLGTTIISLGLLDRSGLWLRTPLVDAEVPGRVIYTKLGSSANVTLLPLAGEDGAGSQLSLAVMQVLGIPLTELADVRVFVR